MAMLRNGWMATAALCVIVVFSACNGGDDGTPPPAQSSGGTVSGTVSGTTVIAVDTAGNIVASDDTTGKVANAQGQFPFTLQNIPAEVPIRLFLVTGGGIFPMFFGGNNFFTLPTAGNVNLGFVATSEGPNGPTATPQTSPTSTTGVTGSLSDGDGIPPGLGNPPTAGFTFAQLLANGFAALKDGAFVRARTLFVAANDRIAEAPNAQDADAARFFSALTRVAALGFDVFSDGSANDVNRIGDLLDKAGCATTARRRATFDALFNGQNPACPRHVMTFASGAELQTFQAGVTLSELTAALNALNAVTSAFNRTWTEPLEGTSVESDLGDALFVRAIVKAGLGTVALQQAYNLGANLTQALTPPNDTKQAFLANNTNFLTPGAGATAALTTARTRLSDALTDMETALNTIQAETDVQANDFIELGGATPAEINDARATLTAARTSLTTGQQQTFPDGFVLNLGLFFTTPGGVNIRGLLPIFTGNTPGFFPDPTLGGIIVAGTNLNQDSNTNNIPDILE